MSVLPSRSTAVTTGCVVRATPLTEPSGGVVKTSCVATTSDTTAVDTPNTNSPVSSTACRLKDSPSTAAVYTTSVNVATPPAAVSVSVPDKTPAPLARLRVTSPEYVPSKAPEMSALTTGCVTNGWPLTEPAGWIWYFNCLVRPGIVFEVTVGRSVPTPSSSLALR